YVLLGALTAGGRYVTEILTLARALPSARKKLSTDARKVPCKSLVEELPGKRLTHSAPLNSFAIRMLH
ncbi:hypothetical protein, partial [Shigella flexneri]|uniref:hypothetical protein n=1 Tax=Shigella flexneri TaxID=623 RepID=UPI001C0A6843